ncbi:MAG: hypothetical protein IPM28_01775 [Chloracidobacterium sp.]|nr:hypothetical protein [Chloracidobacterium sp.]
MATICGRREEVAIHMSRYLNKTLALAALCITLGITNSLGQSKLTNRNNRELSTVFSDLANFHSATYEQSLRALFSLPPSQFDSVLNAVTSSNLDESDGAQRLIRYLGDRELLSKLVENCKTRCLLSGPVPIPLHPLDYREIEYLTRAGDVCKWGEFDMRYVFALFLDTTQPALELRRRVENGSRQCASNAILTSTIRTIHDTKGLETAFTLQNSVEAVRSELFFLTEVERERAKIQFLGFNFQKNRALFEVLVNNGILASRYVHVVFHKVDSKNWQFYSITVVNQS